MRTDKEKLIEKIEDELLIKFRAVILLAVMEEKCTDGMMTMIDRTIKNIKKIIDKFLIKKL